MIWTWRNFSPQEFESPDEAESGYKMKPEFMERLQKARTIAGIAFIITSGYRSESHNEKVGGSKTSSHLKGVAADISTHSSGQRLKIVSALLQAGFTRIGIGQNFIHVDSDKSKPDSMFDYY